MNLKYKIWDKKEPNNKQRPAAQHYSLCDENVMWSDEIFLW